MAAGIMTEYQEHQHIHRELEECKYENTYAHHQLTIRKGN